MNTEKKCFKCEEVKPLKEFYKHSQMADGHLNKCRDCTRLDTKENRAKNLDYYTKYDRERAMRPDRVAARLAYKQTERGKQATKTAHENQKKRRPERIKARSILNNAIRDGKIIRPKVCKCGARGRIEAHHVDYSKPLKVKWLCRSCHVKADRRLGVRK